MYSIKRDEVTRLEYLCILLIREPKEIAIA